MLTTCRLFSPVDFGWEPSHIGTKRHRVHGHRSDEQQDEEPSFSIP